ncbi:MAG: type I-C CRISPR-associated protein Cas8c/Csd1 [Selenomonadaceae bacterium]|nr:type I-C CRISPR-associated protein Cas8c/Csd1 [Selenomonadaceae bacterium]
MIIESLVKRYETLAKEGKLPLMGWGNEKISYGLRLNENGEITEVVDLRTETVKGKKRILSPTVKILPERVERSNNVNSNFLYDNAAYLLGLDSKGDYKKGMERFSAAKEKHLQILDKCNSKMAVAIKIFFKTWIPAKNNIQNCDPLKNMLEDIKESNLIFMLGDTLAVDDNEIKAAYQKYLDDVQGNLENNKKMRCIVTGKKENIARTHPMIKGIVGTPSSGGKLISFNKDSPSHESYGKYKDQGFNAPISQYVAFAYTTALNNLLQNRKYVRRFGDTTLVYWADKSDEEYQGIFDYFLAGDNQGEISEQFFSDTSEALENGETVCFNGKSLDINTPFNILGLTANTARISIRFFIETTLGEALKNLMRHHQNMEIVSSKSKYFPLFRLEKSLVSSKSQDRDLTPILACSFLKSLFSGNDYPKTLLSRAIKQTYLEQDSKDKKLPNYKISFIRCAIIKAYFIRNYWREMTVALNEEEKDVGYVLGRIFAVLEAIQKKSNPEVTIKDRYFNSFCTMPKKTFPIINNLSQYHLKKLKGGLKIYYDKLLRELMGKLSVESIPSIMPLERQGMVILGYYHQNQSLYTKKEDA